MRPPAKSRWLPILSGLLLCLMAVFPSTAQVIEFESGGLQYQTLTREGLTVMIARLPATLRAYSVLQVSIANGTAAEIPISPEDFHFTPNGRPTFAAASARSVVQDFIRNPNRDDVIKLVGTYEMSLYGMAPRLDARNGYESRRQSALAELSFKNLKAAAAASAIALVDTKLGAGDTTDGAVFFPINHGPLHGGRVVVRTSQGLEFSFNPFRDTTATP